MSEMTVDERHHSPYFAPRRTAHEPVAQSVEQLTFNQWVRGSNPLGITIRHFDLKLLQLPFRQRSFKSTKPFRTHHTHQSFII